MLDFIDLGFKNDGICNFVGVGILSTNHKVPGLFVISRYWYVIFTLPSNNRASRVEDERGSIAAPFPVPAHQTGRAELPHPAFRLDSPQGTRRSAFLTGLGKSTPSSPNTFSEGQRRLPRERTLCRHTRKRLTRL
jgi:hypothetical protein